MTRGIIKPLDMSFGEAIRRIFKSDTQSKKPAKRDKVKERPDRQTARPPDRLGVNPPASS